MNGTAVLTVRPERRSSPRWSMMRMSVPGDGRPTVASLSGWAVASRMTVQRPSVRP